ncbi:MAG: PAC2 family protein [Acidimicrobiia bacterium]|nr:PAC2 family protein [Acidimicrobiia bacterium]
MDAIRRFNKPHLRRPRAILAFEGWNDAADSASGSINYLLEELHLEEPFAAIDPEEFYDFQAHRPQVAVDDGGTRSLSWPMTRFFGASLQEDERDLLLVVGDEPSFRWKTYARHITQVLVENDVEEAVLLGAFIGQVSHQSPVPVVGVATDPAMVNELGLMKSSYQGPTGIVGVLLEACREVGLPTLSLWAATPHYLAANPNPKAMLALTQAAGSALDLKIDLGRLDTMANDFVERVDRAIESSDDLKEYVDDLDGTENVLDPNASDELLGEIEDFLREQPDK